MKQHRKTYSQNLEKCKRATPKKFFQFFEGLKLYISLFQLVTKMALTKNFLVIKY
jgi:hypothetical protein